MNVDHRDLKQYPQDKRHATVHNVEWMQKFLDTSQSSPQEAAHKICDFFSWEKYGPL